MGPRPSAPVRAAAVLAWREIIRFLRQRHRVLGAIGQPIVFWLLFGAGLHQTFQLAPGESQQPTFLEYFLPGTVVLIVLFTAIFATISIIEDRREGFLQAVLVAPVPRWSMVLGKVAGGSLIAMLHAVAFLLLALMLPVELRVVRVLTVLPLLLLAAVALTSLGFLLAWGMDSAQGFHAVMSVVLLPMWLLSGAFFPVPLPNPGGPWSQIALHWCMRLNPLTYCVAGVRGVLYGEFTSNTVYAPSLSVCWWITAVSAGGLFVAAWLSVCRAERMPRGGRSAVRAEVQVQ
jgi:ABC-2 type transport system permease protein